MHSVDWDGEHRAPLEWDTFDGYRMVADPVRPAKAKLVMRYELRRDKAGLNQCYVLKRWWAYA